ncbi:MAG: undecaprenyl-diphosphate phosphatase [Firmicutes bacterium]|nr:undecaprenyl-diphosphate phosphatase [Bacillota bacterium]
MSIWKAIVLGIVQGLTEFLPVSSSGHLVLLGQLFGLEEPDLTFDVMVHLGTLIAVVVALRGEIGLLLQGLRPMDMEQGPAASRVKAGRRLILLLVIGTLPAAVVGLIAKDFIEQLFGSVAFVGVALLITGSLLWWAEGRHDGGRTLEEMKPQDALHIGTMQILALAPGISRSGTTISGGLVRGLTRSEAARFSFLLSIPVIAGAVLLQIDDLFAAFAGGTWVPLVAGTVAAALSGFVAIEGLLKLIRHHSLRVFSYYTWAVGLMVLILPHFLR